MSECEEEVHNLSTEQGILDAAAVLRKELKAIKASSQYKLDEIQDEKELDDWMNTGSLNYHPYGLLRRVRSIENRIQELLEVYLPFINSGCQIEDKNNWGYLISYGKQQYYFQAGTGKWRNKGNSTVYRARGLQHFLDQYVLKNRR